MNDLEFESMQDVAEYFFEQHEGALRDLKQIVDAMAHTGNTPVFSLEVLVPGAEYDLTFKKVS